LQKVRAARSIREGRSLDSVRENRTR